MRTQGNSDASDLYYFLTDQVNSTSKTVNQNGDVSEIRYEAWGETRSTSEPMVLVPTDRKYTGQIEDEAGLYFYNARWYDPVLGRFVQADTLVPDPSSPISWDRYAYTVNNPIRNNDPSGHVNCDEEGNCYGNYGEKNPYQTQNTPKIINHYKPYIDYDKVEWLRIPFKVTYYTIALESDESYKDDYPVEAPGLPGTYKYGFIWSDTGVLMQGTGRTIDGKYITIDWLKSDPEKPDWKFTYGVGGKFGKPEAWATVATGDVNLPLGTKIVISSYPGRIFTVTDSGYGVGEGHIDIFIGEYSIAIAFGLGTLENVQVGIIR